MQFLSIREFNRAPKTALTRLAQDGKAVLTNNGKPAAIMIAVNADSFEQVFSLVQEAENRPPVVHIQPPVANCKKQMDAFKRLMNFTRKKAPVNFDYKKELLEAMDERFGSFN